MSEKIHTYEMPRRRLSFRWRLAITLGALAVGCFLMEAKLDNATTVDHASFAFIWHELGVVTAVLTGVTAVLAWLVTGRVR